MTVIYSGHTTTEGNADLDALIAARVSGDATTLATAEAYADVSVNTLANLTTTITAADSDLVGSALTRIFFGGVSRALRLDRLAGYVARAFGFFVLTDPKFGATGNGTDETAQLQACVAAACAGGGRVITPIGTFLHTDSLVITNHGVVIEGVSGRFSRLRFNPTVTGKAAVDFINANSGVTLNRCGIRNLTIESTNTVQKTAIRWTDVSEFDLDGAHVDISFVGAAASIGWESRGREYVYGKRSLVYADIPCRLSQNPRHASIDSDFMSFDQCAFVPTLQVPAAGTGTVSAAAGTLTFSTSQAGLLAAGAFITVGGVSYGVMTFNGTTSALVQGAPTFGASTFTITPASPNYPITIDSNIRSLQHLRITKSIFAQGAGGLSWVSTAATQDCVSIILDQVRAEQTQNAIGYFVNIDRNANLLYGLRLIACSPGTTQHGIRLRRNTFASFDNIIWASTDPLLMAVDLDATSNKIWWDRFWTQIGAGASLTGLTQVWALTRFNSVDLSLPVSAYYDTATNGAVAFGSNILYTSNAVRRCLRFTSGSLDTYQNDGATLAHREFASGRQVHPQGITIGSEAAATILTQVTVYKPTLTPASVAANTTAPQTFTVAGLTTADTVLLNVPDLGNAAVPVCWRVSAADTLKVWFNNPTAGALTPTAGVYPVIATRT